MYWQPVWHVLEDDFELTLCNARHVERSGRKTDVSDAQWLCQLMEAGLLRSSFVPPKPQRRLRTLTRYRKTQIAERQREANRLHKALEDTGIKLDCVASDILGASGRAMLDALVAGTTDPVVLAELAKGLRAKLPGPSRSARRPLRSSPRARDRRDPRPPGLPRRADRAAHRGDRNRAGPTDWTARARRHHDRRRRAHRRGHRRRDRHRHARVRDRAAPCLLGRPLPRNDQSAGKRRSGRTRKGSKWLGIALEEAALAAIRTKNTYLAAQYQRLKPSSARPRTRPCALASPPSSCAATASTSNG